jgi:hypothetical protein
MHVSHIHHASITKARASKARCSCTFDLLAARPTTTRVLQTRPALSRGLWWWSRRGNEWSTYLDEHLQTRLQREQKIMGYKYSKALRRRALWEREGAHRHWGWHLPSHWIRRRRFLAGENLSSSPRPQADLQKPKEDEASFIRPLENQYSEEFARFKAGIDRDPFVAVFGRRLESPPSSNNSSWISLLKIFESVPADEERSTSSGHSPGPSPAAINADSGLSNQKSAKPVSEDSGDKSTQLSFATKPSVSSEEAEYEFDPISMKKLPKKKPTTEPETQPETKIEKPPFVSSLFAEQGVDIPVKTYKPHKVYGYPRKEEPQAPSDENCGVTRPKTVKKKFESSRLQELQKLKANALGNGVDATNFCGKYQVKEDDSKIVAPEESKPASSAENAVEDAPLFSGTTYAAKSQAIVGTKAEPTKDWLAEEGFRTFSSTPEPPSNNSYQAPPPEKRMPLKPNPKIEPALDRMPLSGGRPVVTQSKQKQPTMQFDREKTEDLDLLRPSDVRAQVRSSRQTRLEVDLNKKEARQKLEADYVSRQQRSNETDANAEDPIAVSARRIQDGLSSLWKRVQNQPQYTNLANTIKNMGAFQDAWKRYSRNRIIENPNEKLVFKDENLSNTPSIYKKTPSMPDKAIDTFTPSQEFLAVERESQTRTAALRAANENAKREEAVRKRHDIELASEIRNAYESQYGPIDVNHRQVVPTAENTTAKATESNLIAVAEPDQQLPPEAQVISSNVPGGETPRPDSKTLQPRVERLIEEVSNTRKALHEVSLHVKAIKSRRPTTYWNTPATEPSPDMARSTVAPNLSKTPELASASLPETNSTQNGAARDIAAYTATVAAANQSAAKAQALQEMRERRTNQFQQREPWVQPLVPWMQESSDVPTRKPTDEKEERVNQVQAREKAAVEASAEVLAQQHSWETTDNQSKEGIGALNPKITSAVSEPMPSPVDAASPVQQSPGLYKILAYDSSTLQISMATTTSSLSASTSGNGDVDAPLHPTEVLSRLNNPAIFLPYFQGLQDEGYEIISGSGDILVFKKVRELSRSPATDILSQTSALPSKQSDGPLQKEAATVLEEIPSKPAPAPPTPPSSPKVRRQEDVFSGSGKSWFEEEAQSQFDSGSEKPSEGAWYRIKRGLRRVFFTALATAGAAYAIGSVAESFGAQQQPLYEARHSRKAGIRPGIYSTESSR